MFTIDTSDFQNNIFRKDIAGNNVVGGYPVTNIINKENRDRVSIGGSNQIGISRFDGLVVPLGLAVNTTMSGGCSQLYKINFKNINEIVDDKMFDALFGKVSHVTAKNKTRKLKK